MCTITNLLGNIRLSYTEVLQNRNELIILEESNYYSFGMQHDGYNKTQKEIIFEGGALRKCSVEIFSERASLPRWQNMTQEEIIANVQHFLDIVPVIGSDY